MNPEMPTEKEFSPEGKKEAIIQKIEECVLDGQKQLETLSEFELLQGIEERELEPLRRQIEEKLGGEERMEMPES